jgi:hypothetical protein
MSWPLPELDATPIDTDFDDIYAVFNDMRKFAEEHADENYVFLNADDPGLNHTPPRVPRMGWTAYKAGVDPYRDTSDSKAWTITLANLKTSMANAREGARDQHTADILRRAFQTRSGRQVLLDTLIPRTSGVETPHGRSGEESKAGG